MNESSHSSPGVKPDADYSRTVRERLGLTDDVLRLAHARHEERKSNLPDGSLTGPIRLEIESRKTETGRETYTKSDIAPGKKDLEKVTKGGEVRAPGLRQVKRKSKATIAKETWSHVIHEISSESYAGTLPAKPYCADDLNHGLIIRSRATALNYKSIQINQLSSRIVALVLDIDRPGAAASWIAAGLPEPNVIVENPENGHAHLTYFLRRPVLAFDKSAAKPQKFFEAIQRGYIRRLRADRGYSGMMTKNPLHVAWRTAWGPTTPYTLTELDAPLAFEDKAPVSRVELSMGFGRNVAVFDMVRQRAYRQCVRFRLDGGTLDGWQARLLAEAQEANVQLDRPLPLAELAHIAKSVAKWTWKKITPAEFSKRQSLRAARRWESHEKAEPWIAYGMSRATYFRHKAKGTLPSLPAAVVPEKARRAA